jgi:putative ABC transport system ATP-binding protein
MLVIENLSKVFNKNSPDEKVIFKNLTLRVKKGEFITIFGENGTGKSTLMNLISGVIFPDSGKIFIDGRDVTLLSEHKRAKFIGRVFQDPLRGIAPNLTIEENLSLAMLSDKKRGLSPGINQQNTEFFREKLKTLNLNLENRLKAKTGLLSGGQRQALTLLMATLAKPKILLLDEHTAALSPNSAKRILGLTEKVTQSEKITTLMITHNPEHMLHPEGKVIVLEAADTNQNHT